jgi:hypothetical protein
VNVIESKLDGTVIVAKLTQDECVFSAIENLVAQYEIKSGLILSGIGMIKNFELSYYDLDGKTYVTHRYEDPHELIAFHGSIVKSENLLLPHIHCAVADKSNNVIGGHLTSGLTHIVIELVLQKLTKIELRRVHNPSTGLMELKC